MRLRLRIHPQHEESLASHLAAQGFPPTPLGGGVLEVLFPGSPAIFAAAADLDLWQARGGCISSLAIDAGGSQRRSLAAR